MQKYRLKGLVELVAESPTGSHVMLRHEGETDETFVITKKEFEEKYEPIDNG